MSELVTRHSLREFEVEQNAKAFFKPVSSDILQTKLERWTKATKQTTAIDFNEHTDKNKLARY